MKYLFPDPHFQSVCGPRFEVDLLYTAFIRVLCFFFFLNQFVRSFSHISKVMLKILQVKLQQYMNHELPDVQAAFRKGREIRDQIANIRWIFKKARESQKHIYFCLIDYVKYQSL